MDDLVAVKTINDRQVHFIIMEKFYVEDEEKPFVLIISERHYTPHQTTSGSFEFDNVESAKQYCQEHYDIAPDEWTLGDFTYNFTFQYRVTNAGAPQPYPVGFANAEILFQLGEVESLGDDEPPTPVFTICGNHEGLRKLAAYLLLCADSEQFDEWVHVHMDRLVDGVITNVAVTLRAPNYLESLKRGTFREASSTFSLGPPGDD